MNTPNDRVVLSIEERRALAARTRRNDRELEVALTSGWHLTRFYSRQIFTITAGFCFMAGVVLVRTTFVQWPVIAVGGVAIQVISLRSIVARWGPTIGASIERRLDRRHQDIP